MLRDRMHVIEKQKVSLANFSSQGLTLDIGGGGEGVIGQTGGMVVAIDPNRNELEESPEGPLKIVMSAQNLQFLNNSFNTVTSFFTLMYIPKLDHTMVFNEIYRVLKPGGAFHIWDVTIPLYPGTEKDIFLVPLEIELKNKPIINTSYGTLWKEHNQNAIYYLDIGRQVGFQTELVETTNEVYYLRFMKI